MVLISRLKSGDSPFLIIHFEGFGILYMACLGCVIGGSVFSEPMVGGAMVE